MDIHLFWAGIELLIIHPAIPLFGIHPKEMKRWYPQKDLHKNIWPSLCGTAGSIPGCGAGGHILTTIKAPGLASLKTHQAPGGLEDWRQRSMHDQALWRVSLSVSLTCVFIKGKKDPLPHFLQWDSTVLYSDLPAKRVLFITHLKHLVLSAY